jgi:uncharacterized membrane protein
MNRLKWILSLVALVVFAGCNYYNPSHPVGAENVPAQEMENPDFSTVQSHIIQPYCATCHGASGAGNVSLDSYAHVKKFLNAVQDSVVVKGNMPPGKPLSKELQQLLVNWISNGAPETHQNPGQGPQPVPSAAPPEELKPTFSSLVANVFSPKCAMCHDTSNQQPITDYQYLKKSGWIVPKDLAKSTLYKAITDNGPQGMPPGDHLSTDEIKAIATWITNGAEDN